MVDPGGDAAQIRLELARHGRSRAPRSSITHGHWDHLGGVADLAEGTGAPVHMAEDERALLERSTTTLPPRVTLRAVHPGRARSGATRRSSSPGSPSRRCGARPFAGHLAFAADGCLFSGDVLFAGSVGRTDLPGRRLGRARSPRSATLLDRFPPETVVYPGHGPATTLGAELATNPFLGELPERTATGEDRGAARDARRPAVGTAALAAGHGRGRGALRALRLPADPDPGVRGHRALRAHVRARAPTSSRRRCTRSRTAAAAR